MINKVIALKSLTSVSFYYSFSKVIRQKKFVMFLRNHEAQMTSLRFNEDLTAGCGVSERRG